MGFGELVEKIAPQIFTGTGIIGGRSLWNVGINSAITGGYIASKFLPLYGTVSSLEYAARSVGIPTTLYDIGERIGFTNFEKRKRLRRVMKRAKPQRRYRVKRLWL